MRAIILEDEDRAANRLKRLLNDLAPEITVTDCYESVADALRAHTEWSDTQVIFSDIQLTDGLSFELFEQVEVNCPVIFTTAYDQYAIKAFKNHGIDYLLKPIDEHELKQALNKLKPSKSIGPSMEDLLQLAKQLATGKTSYKEHFMVKVGQKLRSISVSEIDAFYSENKGTYILTDSGRSYLLDYPLDKLDTMVDKEEFFRVNRAYLIKRTAIDEMLMWSNSRLKVKLKAKEVDDIIVARDRTPSFKEWMGA